MDWQRHTLEPPYQFRLVSLKIVGCRYLILETETCPWNVRAFTNIHKVTKPDRSQEKKKEKKCYDKYNQRELRSYLFLVSKILSTEHFKQDERKSTQIPKHLSTMSPVQHF